LTVRALCAATPITPVGRRGVHGSVCSCAIPVHAPAHLPMIDARPGEINSKLLVSFRTVPKTIPERGSQAVDLVASSAAVLSRPRAKTCSFFSSFRSWFGILVPSVRAVQLAINALLVDLHRRRSGAVSCEPYTCEAGAIRYVVHQGLTTSRRPVMCVISLTLSLLFQ
jgi:hypothetical protein